MKLRKVYKWLPVILVILSCPLSADRVVLANRHYGDPSSNLRGELSIKDSEGNIETVASGTEVEVLVGDTVTVSTLDEYLQNKKHIMWNEEAMECRLDWSNLIINENHIDIGISAYFEDQYEVSNNSSPAIKIKDPWYVNDQGNQTGEDWVEFEDTYEVFLDRNTLFFDSDPIYSIKAPQYYADTEGIYEFTHWEGEDIFFDDNGSTSTTSRETDVVFLTGDATVTAHYDLENPVNTQSREFVMEVDDEFIIPAGANIEFVDNFTFTNNGFLKIGSINGETTNIYFDGYEQNNCRPFNMTQMGQIAIENAAITNTSGINLDYDYELGSYTGEPVDKIYLDQVSFNNSNCINTNISPYGFEDTGLSSCKLIVKNCELNSSIMIEAWYSELIITGNIMNSAMISIHNSNNVHISNNYFNGTSLEMLMFSGNLNNGGLTISKNLFNLDSSDRIKINLGDFGFPPSPYTVNIYNNSIIGEAENIEEQLLLVSRTDNIESDVNLVIKNNILSSNTQEYPVDYYAISIEDFPNLDYSIGFNDFWSFRNPYNNGITGENDIFDDPLFLDPLNNDYTLLCTSPCIDTGDPNLPPDPDGTQSDIGAYSFDQTQLWTLNISGDVGDHPVLSWDVCCIDNYLQNQVWRYYIDLDTDGNLIANSNMGPWIDTDYVISRIDEEEESITIRVQKVKPSTGHHQRVNYRVRQEDTEGRTCPFSNEVYTYRLLPGAISKETNSLPKVFALHANYPNPFNPYTTIVFDIPKETNITLTIYDVMGRVVKELINENIQAGTHRVLWNGTNDNGQPIPSGMYFCQLKSDDYLETMKLVLLK